MCAHLFNCLNLQQVLAIHIRAVFGESPVLSAECGFLVLVSLVVLLAHHDLHNNELDD